MDSSERDMALSAPRDVPIRDSAPPSSSRTFARSHEASWPSGTAFDVPPHPGADVWRGAMSRLQTQVSLNTSMLESHRRQLDSLKQDLGNVVATLHDIQMELRAKPSAPMPGRHDPGDLDLLVSQVEAVTSKAGEVDAIKLQLDLMKNRMKRLEDQSVVSAGLSARPGTATSSTHRDVAVHEAPGALHHALYPHGHHPAPPHHQHHQPLPPMRTSSMASPIQPGHPVGPHAVVPTVDAQNRPGYPPPPPPQESRHYSTDSSTLQPSPMAGFRPSEPLPPPSSLPGWRSSESLSHSTGLPHPQSAAHTRPPTMEPEPHAASGWASINAGQATKRPYEEPRASPYDSPGSGSPKRPKLAPIMPRSSYGDDSYVPSSVGQSIAGDSSAYARSRAASEVSQSQSQIAHTPASTNTSSYRFITSTAQADSQDSWRPEHERRMHGHGHGHGPHPQGPGHGGGRRGGGGGGGRGRGGRGGRRGRGGGVPIPIQETRELGTPEWERPDWTGSQVSPNGYYHPLQPYSPRAARGGLMRRGGGGPAGSPPNREIESPHTPTYNPEDPSINEPGEGGPGTSGGKKTRTKPIRNAEGILIRKDGRPDMRSVSSANNLRKVHAKKEAERSEIDGKTPTSARSLAPAHTFEEEDDEHEHERSQSGTPGTNAGERDDMEDDEDRHHPHHRRQNQHSGAAGRGRDTDLMGRMFDHSNATARNVAERFFPRHHQQQLQQPQQDVPEAQMRTAPEPQQREDSHNTSGRSSGQMTDVVMREMSEAQAADHREREEEDTKMATVEEMQEEQGEAALPPPSGGDTFRNVQMSSTG